MLRPEECDPAHIPLQVAQKDAKVPHRDIEDLHAMHLAVDDPNAVHQFGEIILRHHCGQILSRHRFLKIETASLVYSTWDGD